MVEGNASVLTLAGSIISPSAEQCVASVCHHWGTDDCDMVSWVGCSSPLKDSVYTRCDRKPQQQPPLVGSATLIPSLLPYPGVCRFVLSFLSLLPLAESQWWSGRHSHEKCSCACVLSPTGREGPDHEGMLFVLTMQSRKGT